MTLFTRQGSLCGITSVCIPVLVQRVQEQGGAQNRTVEGLQLFAKYRTFYGVVGERGACLDMTGNAVTRLNANRMLPPVSNKR